MLKNIYCVKCGLWCPCHRCTGYKVEVYLDDEQIFEFYGVDEPLKALRCALVCSLPDLGNDEIVVYKQEGTIQEKVVAIKYLIKRKEKERWVKS